MREAHGMPRLPGSAAGAGATAAASLGASVNGHARARSIVSPEERQLLEMGFHLRDVREALRKAGGDAERAVAHLL